MNFSDKLINLRKEKNWSQEELAEKMDVTRQSVSKWEGGQSVPDVDKIVELSKLFDVSTDYLLKDEIEYFETQDYKNGIKKVSMEEAKEFLDIKKGSAIQIALGVFLCMLSPILLFIIGAMSEMGTYGMSDNSAVLGVVALLILVAIAVVIFLSNSAKINQFEFIEKEVFELDYNAEKMVKDRRADYRNSYNQNNIIGTCICILSAIPILIGAFLDKNDLFMVTMLSVTIVIVGIGAIFLVKNGVIWGGFEKLLQEGDYTKAKKEFKPVFESVSSIYWFLVTAIYLSYSFITNNWGKSWIIWVVFGVLYPVFSTTLGLTQKDKK